MITYSAPGFLQHAGADLAGEGALRAPSGGSAPATPTVEFRTASATACSAVNGGATTISTSSTSLTIAAELLREHDRFVHGLEHLPVGRR